MKPRSFASANPVRRTTSAKQKNDRLAKALALSLGLSFAAGTTAQAQVNQTWLPGGPTNDWNTSDLNWDAGAVWVNNNNASFGTTAETVTVSEANIVFNDITFSLTGYTIADGAGSLRLGNDLASTITSGVAAATINETIADNLGGASSLTKAGTGTLTLGGANTYSGGTTITGILTAANSSGLGTGGVTVNIGAGNYLQLGNGVNVSNALTINGGGATGIGTLHVPTNSAATYSGTINVTAVQSAGSIFATADPTARLTIAGNNTITTTVPITIRAGTVHYTGTQNYTTGTTMTTADSRALIQFKQPTSMPATGTVTLLGGTSVGINLGGAGEFTDGTGTTTAGTIGGLLAGIGGQGAAVALPANSSIAIDTTNAAGTVTYGSAWTSTNNVGLLKLGTGTLALTSGGTYAGPGAAAFPFHVRQGTVLLNGGTHAVTGETVVGGTYGNAGGSAGVPAALQIDSGALTTTGFLSIARGNGVGAVSSDVVLNNAATLSAANFGIGFNGGNAANTPRGTLTLNGTSNLTLTAAGAVANIAESAGSNARVTLNNSSSITASGATVGFRVGQAGTGVLDIASPTATVTSRNLIIGQGTNGVGAVYNMGTVLGLGDGIFMGDGSGSASYFRNDNAGASVANANALRIDVGVNTNSNGVFDMVSGSMSATTFRIGRNNANASNAQFNVSGGQLSAGTGGVIYENTAATNKWANFNVTGGTFASTGPINLSTNNSALNTSLLSVTAGGTVSADTITTAGTNSNTFINFNGGTLKASGATPSLVTANIDRLTVYSGGVTVDTNGLNKSIDAVIAAPVADGATTFGVTSVSLSGTGTGYEGRPIVKISGGGGTGATAIANFNVATGEVTGVTITSPGSGYTSAPTVEILGGGGTALTATATTGAVTGGGITKIGAGILTISSLSTYTGSTEIDAGTLLLTGSLSATSAVNVDAGATLGGTGTINSAAALNVSGNLSPGLSPGQFTTGSVAFANGGDFTLELNGATLGSLYDNLNVIGSVSLGSADLFVSLGAGFAPSIGQTFTVVSNDLAEIIAGTFGTVNGGSFGAGNTFALTNDQGTFGFAVHYDGEGAAITGGNDVVFEVVPEPGVAVSLFGGLGILLGLRRRR